MAEVRGSGAKNKLPPGPAGKPLIGNLWDIDPDQLHQSFADLGKGFGDVFSLRLGGQSVVVVQSLGAYRELYEQGDTEENVSSRETNFISTYITGGKGIASAKYSPEFQKRKNAVRSAVQSFGESQESKWLEELGHIVDCSAKKLGEPQELVKPTCMYLVNILLTTITGQRYDHNDPRFEMFLERTELMQTLIRPRVTGVMARFPFLRHIPLGYGKLYRRAMQIAEQLKETVFNREKASFDPHNPKGAIGELFKLRQDTEEGTDSWLSEDHIWASMNSVLGAGTAVTIGDLLFFPLIVVHQPEVAVKIQKEIDQVIGRDRLPTLADREAMPYTEAFILELLRYVSPAPLLVPRSTVDDVKFRDYLIPKDTTIMANAWLILHDENLWDEPWTFRPERFLDLSGSLLPPTSEQRRNLIIFGSGRRACIGPQIYKAAAFLFISALLQRFDFDTPPGGVPSSDPHHSHPELPGIWPMPYKVVLRDRADRSS